MSLPHFIVFVIYGKTRRDHRRMAAYIATFLKQFRQPSYVGVTILWLDDNMKNRMTFKMNIIYRNCLVNKSYNYNIFYFKLVEVLVFEFEHTELSAATAYTIKSPFHGRKQRETQPLLIHIKEEDKRWRCETVVGCLVHLQSSVRACGAVWPS